jgi:tellurite resistance protein TerB
MELKRPNPEQAYWGLRAMKTVALADGALDASERHMMESIQRILGTDHTLEQLTPITPADLAHGIPDQQIRHQLVQGMIVMSLIDGEAKPARQVSARACQPYSRRH